MNHEHPVLIMAGGTGGHVFPGLATAEVLRARGIPVAWLGTRKGIEAELVPAAGIAINYIDVAGVRGKGLLSLLLAPLQIIRAVIQALTIVRRLRPRCVLGMGGFAAGPGGIAAWLLRRPLLIHEQNAKAGTTNRILSNFAKYILEAFPGTFAANKRAVHTGNPIRAGLYQKEQQSISGTEHSNGSLNILVLGGSLGAKAINETLPKAFKKLAADNSLSIIHQSGRRHIEAVNALYESLDLSVEVLPFIDDMNRVYHWADLVIARAGALTVSEIAAAGRASLLIPYPYAIDDHQTANAHWLVDKAAAVLMPQNEMTEERLVAQLSELFSQPQRLAQMAEHAKALAIPDAAEKVAQYCLEVARNVD